MNPPLIVLLITMLCISAMRADMIPSEPKTPLFRIYEIAPQPDTGPDPHTHRANVGQCLLTVFALRDLQLLPGDAARVTLNAHDARTFSQATHTHQYLFLLAGDEKAGVTMHITGPIDDGVITFTSANYSTSVARYLRRRYAKSPNHAMQPTAGRRTLKFLMTSTSSPVATRALASGG